MNAYTVTADLKGHDVAKVGTWASATSFGEFAVVETVNAETASDAVMMVLRLLSPLGVYPKGHMVKRRIG